MEMKVKNAKLLLNKVHVESGNPSGFGFVVKYRRRANQISVTFTDYSKLEIPNYQYLYNKEDIDAVQTVEGARRFYEAAFAEFTTPRVKKGHKLTLTIEKDGEVKTFSGQRAVADFLGYRSVGFRIGRTYRGWTIKSKE